MSLMQLVSADGYDRTVVSAPAHWPAWVCQWLLPVLTWVARQCGARVSRITDVQVTYRTLDTAPLLTRLAAQRDLVAHLTHTRPLYLLVGRDVYAAMLQEPARHEFRSFPLRVQAGVQVYGLTVLLCPWVEGMCVLPELPKS